MKVALINPPVFRPSEPPPGPARLAGALKSAGTACVCRDAGIGALSWMDRSGPSAPVDNRTRRVIRKLGRNLEVLRTPETYSCPARYIRAVHEVDLALGYLSRPMGARAGITTYRHKTLSPLRSLDLLHVAVHPEEDPFHPYLETCVREVLAEHDPDVVGISVTFLDQVLCAFALAGLCRRYAERLRIVLGGGLVTSWARSPSWTNPFAGLVDEIVAGPGERSLPGIDGAASFLPDYEPFVHEPYLSPGLVLPFAASTGCYWNRCSFCLERTQKTPYAALAPHEALDQVESLCTKYRPVLVHFTDNALSPSLLRAIAHRGLPASWYGFARITPELADEGFCRDLRRSGCVMLQLGIESGDQDVLDALGKGIRVDDASRALTALKASGIGTYVYLLFGTPAENESAARRTLSFTEAHADRIDFLNLAIFNLPRHSEQAQNLSTYEFFDADLSLYTGFSHPLGWDRIKVRRFLDREFRQSPPVTRILANDPPFFTSSHAPFFLMHRKEH